MRMRFESYLGAELPYSMSYDEYKYLLDTVGRITEVEFLAALRGIGPEHVRLDFKMRAPQVIAVTDQLAAVVHDSTSEEVVTELKLVLDPKYTHGHIYNPFFNDADDAWYSSYKIKVTAVEFCSVIDSYYVTDIVGFINRGVMVLKQPTCAQQREELECLV